MTDGLPQPVILGHQQQSITENCSVPSTGYDALGRLTAITCTGAGTWAQAFGYDTFGNINQSGSSNWNQAYSLTTNQISTGGYTYDGNGNLMTDGSNSYTWDPNWGNPSTIGGNSLVYDAFGRMVENSTTGTEYVYTGPGSQILAQMSGQTVTQVQYPLPGGNLAIYKNGALTYARTDMLGSARLVTDSNQNWLDESGYSPFGLQYNSQTSNVSGAASFYDFTGQQQWTVTGIDDFPFRKYIPAQGRWMSPDPGGLAAVDVTDPQTWNRYAYVANNPLSFIDPLGLDLVPAARPLCPGSPATRRQGMAAADAGEDPTIFLPTEGTTGGSGGGRGRGRSGGNGGTGSPSRAIVAARWPLNPNSDECQQLAQSIQNKLDQITKRNQAILTNPQNLPDYAPGPPSGSVSGHQQLVDQLWDNLISDVNLYQQKCGGGTGAGAASANVPVSRPLNPTSSNFTVPNWVVPAATGGAAACAILVPGCFEVELPFLPALP